MDATLWSSTERLGSKSEFIRPARSALRSMPEPQYPPFYGCLDIVPTRFSSRSTVPGTGKKPLPSGSDIPVAPAAELLAGGKDKRLHGSYGCYSAGSESGTLLDGRRMYMAVITTATTSVNPHDKSEDN